MTNRQELHGYRHSFTGWRKIECKGVRKISTEGGNSKNKYSSQAPHFGQTLLSSFSKHSHVNGFYKKTTKQQHHLGLHVTGGVNNLLHKNTLLQNMFYLA